MPGSGASLRLLRWVVAAVSALGAAQLLSAVARGSGPSIPRAVAAPIGIAEIVAAVLFVLPGRAGRIGGIALLCVYAGAALVHVLHGQYGVGGLVVLAAATWAVLEGGR